MDARNPAGDQGPVGDKGHPHHAGLAVARALRARRRQPDGDPHEDRRMHRDRQDQRARVRAGLAHVQRCVRHDPQPVRPHPHRRWQQWWRRGGAGDAHAACGRRQRLHGLVAQPGGMEQRVRVSAEPGSRPRWSRARQLPRPTRYGGPDGAHGAGRSAAARHAGGVRRRLAAVAVGPPRRVRDRCRGATHARCRAGRDPRRLAG